MLTSALLIQSAAVGFTACSISNGPQAANKTRFAPSCAAFATPPRIRAGRSGRPGRRARLLVEVGELTLLMKSFSISAVELAGEEFAIVLITSFSKSVVEVTGEERLGEDGVEAFVTWMLSRTLRLERRMTSSGLNQVKASKYRVRHVSAGQ
jgi:hypothetical protein